MLRLWAREFKNTHMLKDVVVTDDSQDTRTHKIMRGIGTICQELDLPQPIWLEQNITDFKRRSKVRFTQDSFIEEVPFDYLEVQVIEED